MNHFRTNPAPTQGLRSQSQLQVVFAAGLPVPANTGTPEETIHHLVEEIANFLTRRGCDFVSVDKAGPLHVLAAQRGRFTLGMALQPSPTTVRPLLLHALEILGCDRLLLLCFDLPSLKSLAKALARETGEQRTNQVGILFIPAMQILISHLNHESK